MKKRSREVLQVAERSGIRPHRLVRTLAHVGSSTRNWRRMASSLVAALPDPPQALRHPGLAGTPRCIIRTCQRAKPRTCFEVDFDCVGDGLFKQRKGRSAVSVYAPGRAFAAVTTLALEYRSSRNLEPPSVGSGNSEPLFPDILNRSVLPGKGSSNFR